MPLRNWDTDEKYYHYLKATLQFPFATRYIDESVPYDKGRNRTGTVVQMFEDLHTDECYGAMCQVREGERLREMPLAELDVPEEDPNFQTIDDYSYWLYNGDDEVSGDDDPDDFMEDFGATDDEDYDDVEDFGSAAFHGEDDFDDEEPPPKLVVRSRTGRNDPCPCGSGKKFKKCCLKKQPPEPETPKTSLFGGGKSAGAMLPLRPTAPALTDTAYQIKVTLLNSEPPIWRRFRVKDCNLATLHHILQIVMGWHDDHLHCFEVDGKTYGDADRSSYGSSMKDAKLMTLGRIVQRELPGFIYEYDFGDSWRHDVGFVGRR